MKKLNLNAKSLVASIACAAAIAGPAALAVAPSAAMAISPGDVSYATSDPRAHYEGENVVIGEDWGQPVYAEWHRGDSGKWWATFWTYNYNYVYATPAPAGCGWVFYTYDHGEFVQIQRVEESSSYNVYGKEGVSSHWQGIDNGKWY